MSAVLDVDFPEFPDFSPAKAKLEFSGDATVFNADGTTWSAFAAYSWVIRATWKGWDGWLCMKAPDGAKGTDLRNNAEFLDVVRNEFSKQAIEVETRRRAEAARA